MNKKKFQPPPSPLTFPTTAKATDKERQSENQKLQNRLETNSKQLNPCEKSKEILVKSPRKSLCKVKGKSLQQKATQGDQLGKMGCCVSKVKVKYQIGYMYVSDLYQA